MNRNELQSFFQDLNAALNRNNEQDFRNLWHNESYTRNLTGIGGFSGDAVFTQAINGKMQLSPELNDLEILEDPKAYLLGCYLKYPDHPEVNQEENDYWYLLLGTDTETQALFLWGAGEDKEGLLGLWNRLSEQKSPISTQQEEGSAATSDIAPIISTEEAALELIKSINKAITTGDEPFLQQSWLPKAYFYNLSGASGLSGQEFFTQAVEGRWQLKGQLEYASLFENPEAILVPCQVWLSGLDMPKAGEDLLLLLVNANRELKAIGIGTELTDMRHLYLSYKL